MNTPDDLREQQRQIEASTLRTAEEAARQHHRRLFDLGLVSTGPVEDAEWPSWIATRLDDPVIGQTDASIEAYLRTVPIGGEVAIRSTQVRCLRYDLFTVADRNPSRGRLYTNGSMPWTGDGWYMKSGMNYYAPSAQSRLVAPTEAVRAYAREYPEGRLFESLLRR